MSPSEKVRDTDVGVFIGSTTSRDTRRLLPDVSSAMYATPGYVLFVRDGALMALPFDAGTLEAGGAPIPVMANVEFSALRSIGTFSASPAGVLAFRTATGPPLLRLAWLNRSGSPAGATEFPEAVIEEMRLSPDGRQAALVLQEARSASGDLWTFDLQRGTRARLTRGNASTTGATAPVFSPDGSRVVVSLGKEEGIEELSALDSSGEGAPETLVSSPLGKTASDWSQDGRFILFEQPGARRNFEIWVYGVSEKRAWPLVQSESTTYFGVFSPDGRWVAYVSNENDQVEVFVRPFTGAGGKQQVSRGVGDGGGLVRWSRDGREIVYQVGDKLIAVDVKGRDRLEFGEPRTLLQFPRGTALWDITPDHQRILIAARTEEAGASPPLSVLTNWAAELKR